MFSAHLNSQKNVISAEIWIICPHVPNMSSHPAIVLCANSNIMTLKTFISKLLTGSIFIFCYFWRSVEKGRWKEKKLFCGVLYLVSYLLYLYECSFQICVYCVDFPKLFGIFALLSIFLLEKKNLHGICWWQTHLFNSPTPHLWLRSKIHQRSIGKWILTL